MDAFEVNKYLKNEVIIIDTREHDTEELRLRKRLFPCLNCRQKLNFGDYSIKTILRDGIEFSLADRVCIERKMSLDEIAQNLTKERERFEREFQRAKDAGATIYVLVENGSYEKIVMHDYRSLLKPKAFITSLCAFMARYNLRLLFCESSVAPLLIYDVLHYELREALLNAEAEQRMDKTVSADD